MTYLQLCDWMWRKKGAFFQDRFAPSHSKHKRAKRKQLKAVTLLFLVTEYLSYRCYWSSYTSHSSLKFFAFLKILSSDGLQTSKIILGRLRTNWKMSNSFVVCNGRKEVAFYNGVKSSTFSCASFPGTSF